MININYKISTLILVDIYKVNYLVSTNNLAIDLYFSTSKNQNSKYELLNINYKNYQKKKKKILTIKNISWTFVKSTTKYQLLNICQLRF